MSRKTVLIILGVVVAIVALGGIIVGGVFYATSGVTGAADRFYEVARGGNEKEIYALTSTELHKVTTSPQLFAYIQANRFNQVADTTWTSRSIENKLGNVEGTLTLDDGGVVPVQMQLVNEGDEWKVSFIEIRPAGVSGTQ